MRKKPRNTRMRKARKLNPFDQRPTIQQGFNRKLGLLDQPYYACLTQRALHA